MQVHTMKKSALIAGLFFVLWHTNTSAQQATENINVLPVVLPESDSDQEYFLKGDAYLQRQVEPTIVVWPHAHG